MYFVLSGDVDLVVNVKNKVDNSKNKIFITLSTLKSGDVIGQYNFFS